MQSASDFIQEKKRNLQYSDNDKKGHNPQKFPAKNTKEKVQSGE